MDKLNIALIGAGKVGRSLHAKLAQQGYTTSLIGKDLTEQERACAQSNLILLCVQDRQIETACQTISPWLKADSVVAHCSGSLGSAALLTAAQRGCHVGSAHPLNSFPTIDAAIQRLSAADHHTHCFISGDPTAQQLLTTLFENLGFITAVIDDANKVKYHAACVFLCNYLTSLAEIGLGVAEQAGLDRSFFWQAVQPLIRTTLANITQHGTVNALSGPIARGDTDTVASHIEALTQSPDLVQQAYKILGRQALELSTQKATLAPATLNQLSEELS